MFDNIHSSRAILTFESVWPGTSPPQVEELDSYSNVWTPQPELRYSYDDRTTRSPSSGSSSTPIPPRVVSKPSSIRAPPRCRLPPSIRVTTLIAYITISLLLLSSITSASPLHNSRSIKHLNLHNRQSVPDRFGNTGNEPAPVASQPPPQPATPSSSLLSTSIATSIPSPSITSTPTILSTTSSQPTDLNTGANGNTNRPGELGINPGSPPEGLTLTSPNFRLSEGAIAGLAAGGFVLLSLFILVGLWAYRRRPSNNVTEIPIRRSKLGSRLGFRIFGDHPSRSASRASSRRGSKDKGDEKEKEKEVEAGWLDKGTISRPKNAYQENGLLSVPKPGFLRDEKDEKEGDVEKAPWVDKGTISLPRPARPASAEPLGPLSGMGLGMGYLK